MVGAGICGLAAARSLKQGGHEVVVFEKSRGVGGRIATRRQDGFVWDTGATSFAPRGRTLESVMLSELDTSDLVTLDKAIYIHNGLRPMASDHRPAGLRYTYRSGNTKLPKLLAAETDVRLSTHIDELERAGDGFRIGGEGFDALILTAPIPQSSLLLWGIGESRPTANAKYRACISVNVGYHVELPPTKYHALLDPEQRHPLNWLSLESVKSPDRAPAGGSALGAQLGPAFSLEQYDTPDAELVDIVGSFLAQLYGPAFREPVSSSVKRWKYAQPVGYASFEEVNPEGSRLILASDALLGGRVEEAYEVGLRAANLLLAR
nr:FAD-dependent oxidoreductase [Fimbriimonas ginsengisoli]